MQTSEEPTAALLDGRYQLGERVGTGGMAEVYRAEDLLLGRTVAVKLMRGDCDLLASTDRARVVSAALASLNHPGLVTLLDARVDPGHAAYLVMEFVDDPTLAQRIGSGPLSDADTARLASQLASALHAVHCAGIVHRDVKPSNVLLAPGEPSDGGFHAKLTDFGAARMTDTSGVTSPGVIIGTAAYLAPEQVRDRTASPPSDVYALGLVLLEALTGERAFAQTTDIDAILARLVEDPVIPPQIGDGWARLLRRMTDADPAARPTAARVVREVADLGFLGPGDEPGPEPMWGEPVPARPLPRTAPTAVLPPPGPGASASVHAGEGLGTVRRTGGDGDRGRGRLAHPRRSDRINRRHTPGPSRVPGSVERRAPHLRTVGGYGVAVADRWHLGILRPGDGRERRAEADAQAGEGHDRARPQWKARERKRPLTRPWHDRKPSVNPLGVQLSPAKAEPRQAELAQPRKGALS